MMYVTYRCESIDCRKKFPWDPTDGYPSACPHCGYRPDEPDDNVIAMPAFLSAKTRANDEVAKKMIDGSSERALLAAQASGQSITEMNNLKLTNLNNAGSVDQTPNPVSNFMSQHNVGGFAGAAPTPAEASQHVNQAMSYAAAAHSGPDAHAGAKAMGTLQKALFNIK